MALFQERGNKHITANSKNKNSQIKISFHYFPYHLLVVAVLLLISTGSSGMAFRSMILRHKIIGCFTTVRSRGRVISSSIICKAQGNEESAKEEHHVAIIGGGLAGLSVAYHLLKQQQTCVSVTIFDSMPSPGVGGASSVAGGLLHPFSPRGNKIVHLGKEALKVANQLINDSLSDGDDTCNVVLRDEFYRLANTEEGGKLLQQAAIQYPNIATWMTKEQISESIYYTSSNFFFQDSNKTQTEEFLSTIFGGVLLTNGCKVIHVPSYLQALWRKCQSLSSQTNSARWIQTPTSIPWQQQYLEEFDSIVYAAGSGMFFQENTSGDTATCLSSPMLTVPLSSLPISFVRGQSIELNFPSHEQQELPAILCGKYFCPLPSEYSTIRGNTNRSSTRILLGATTEHYDFKQKQVILRSPDDAKRDLKKRTSSFFPKEMWHLPHFKSTSGWRVQSYRTFQGRLPIVGKLDSKEHAIDGIQDAWIFTGLSSRGLLYHGLFGRILSEAILQKSDVTMIKKFPELNWWRRMMTSKT